MLDLPHNQLVSRSARKEAEESGTPALRRLTGKNSNQSGQLRRRPRLLDGGAGPGPARPGGKNKKFNRSDHS